jgi:hypothetical protein
MNTKTPIAKTKLKAAGNLQVKSREVKPPAEIYLRVYVKDKGFKVYCSDGKQKLRWLIDVALLMFDRPFALSCGPVLALRLPDESIIQDFSLPINSSVREFNTIFVMLKDDFEDFVETNKKNRGNLVTSSKK